MTATNDITEYLDTLLGTSTIADYPGALNGLQLENHGDVTRIAACVDFSSRAVQGTVNAGANLLIVHHGMFWRGAKRISGAAYRQLATLLEHDIAVYSSHLPLDRHPVFGNNVLLCKELGLEPMGGFASFKDVEIGLKGKSDLLTSELLKRAAHFAANHQGSAIATGFDADRRTSEWAVCSGAGASTETLEEAVRLGIDTLIVGEGPHHTAVDAHDLGIVIIYAGHYATETLGVQAIAEHAGEHFGLEWSMIHAPTGL